MYEWKFTTDDSNDIVTIAAALRNLGAGFCPERDQLVMAAEPAGYATFEEGPGILYEIAGRLAHQPADCPSPVGFLT